MKFYTKTTYSTMRQGMPITCKATVDKTVVSSLLKGKWSPCIVICMWILMVKDETL